MPESVAGDLVLIRHARGEGEEAGDQFPEVPSKNLTMPGQHGHEGAERAFYHFRIGVLSSLLEGGEDHRPS
eukprot:scaffold642_cov232-Pinguiococcus_pyrenoidosus.AAC.12